MTEPVTDPATEVTEVEGPSRPVPAMIAGEREALRSWLEYHRATLRWKCRDLDDAALRRKPIATSDLSLLGLLRHAAEVENHWFRRIIGGDENVEHVWSDRRDFQAAFDVSDATVADAEVALTSAVHDARDLEAKVSSLDDTFLVEQWGGEADLRMLLQHLIHEYARHNGHADLLREAIDGVTGT